VQGGPSGEIGITDESQARQMRAGFWQRGIGFLSYLERRFVEDECLLWAGALSYSTLLAIVPLTAVVLAAFSAFPVFDTWFEQLQGFIFANFVPATGETVQQYVRQFVSQVSRLTAVGVAFLVVTSLLLVSEIERAFNQIWRVRQRPPLRSRLAIYWTALTVGPLLIGASLAISSYVVSLPLVQGAAATGAGHTLLALVPFAIELVAFTLAYVIVPSTSVRWLPAAAGGLLAAVLFEAAKAGFAYYVSSVPTYEIIYGALAAIPIFLVWIFLSWIVVLFGALFAAALQTFRIEAHLHAWARDQELQLTFRMIGHLWEAQQQGEGRSFHDLLRIEPAAKDAQLQRLLEGLGEKRLIRLSSNGEWLLARDPAQVTLLDLYRSGNFSLPLAERIVARSDGWNVAFRRVMGAVERPVAERLERPLKELYDESVGLQPAVPGGESGSLEKAGASAMVPVSGPRPADGRSAGS
jgi:membrane protein